MYGRRDRGQRQPNRLGAPSAVDSAQRLHSTGAERARLMAGRGSQGACVCRRQPPGRPARQQVANQLVPAASAADWSRSRPAGSAAAGAGRRPRSLPRGIAGAPSSHEIHQGAATATGNRIHGGSVRPCCRWADDG